MSETALVIFTALISGLVATGVTIWWQKRSQIKIEKTAIFKTLMAKRYDLTSEESVEAFNMIDIVFYHSKTVRDAWKEFMTAVNMPNSPSTTGTIQDKHLKLLEVMAVDIGYKTIAWDNIKHYYYPVGLSDRRQDEATLRRIQIDAGLAQIKGSQIHTDAVRNN